MPYIDFSLTEWTDVSQHKAGGKEEDKVYLSKDHRYWAKTASKAESMFYKILYSDEFTTTLKQEFGVDANDILALFPDYFGETEINNEKKIVLGNLKIGLSELAKLQSETEDNNEQIIFELDMRIGDKAPHDEATYFKKSDKELYKDDKEMSIKKQRSYQKKQFQTPQAKLHLRPIGAKLQPDLTSNKVLKYSKENLLERYLLVNNGSDVISEMTGIIARDSKGNLGEFFAFLNKLLLFLSKQQTFTFRGASIIFILARNKDNEITTRVKLVDYESYLYHNEPGTRRIDQASLVGVKNMIGFLKSSYHVTTNPINYILSPDNDDKQNEDKLKAKPL